MENNAAVLELSRSDLSEEISTQMDRALDRRFGSDVAGAPAAPAAAFIQEAPADREVAELAQYVATRLPRGLAPDTVLASAPDGSYAVRSRAEIAGEEQVAELHAAALGGLANQLDNAIGTGVPWGSVLVGAVPGLIVGEVIDGIWSPVNDDGNRNLANIGVKVAVAAAGAKWGGQLVGRTASKFFAGALILQIVADILPIDDWVESLLNLFKRNGSGSAVQEQNLAQRQANQIAAAGLRQATPITPGGRHDAIGAMFV